MEFTISGWHPPQIDRGRNGGVGRDVHASRLAGGLSAIGALSLGIGGEGLPKHLEAVKVSHVRQVSTAVLSIASSYFELFS